MIAVDTSESEWRRNDVTSHVIRMVMESTDRPVHSVETQCCPRSANREDISMCVLSALTAGSHARIAFGLLVKSGFGRGELGLFRRWPSGSICATVLSSRMGHSKRC